MAEIDPLACGNCKHSIDSHKPADYGKDVCVALGYRQPFGGVCTCEGFVIKRPALSAAEHD